MLETDTLSLLKNKKNLLAFSAGGDSTALFFLLLQNNIKFDIAIVNYNLREQAKAEVDYAQELCKKNNLSCFIHNAKKITSNFESNARSIRYDFFEKTIKENLYENLLTAHHLGDRFEWMLMQFCKGAGCAELSGMQIKQERDNYALIRPLLHLNKSELIEYLQNKDIQYFEDETNQDESIKRNYFRHNFTNELLEQHLDGIKKSFLYLDEDKQSLITSSEMITKDELTYFKSTNPRSDIYNIDKYLKSIGHIITSNERTLLSSEKAVILGRKFLVVKEKLYTFITPYSDKKVVMEKEYKELFRTLNIEPKFRNFLYQNNSALQKVKELITRP